VRFALILNCTVLHFTAVAPALVRPVVHTVMSKLWRHCFGVTVGGGVVPGQGGAAAQLFGARAEAQGERPVSDFLLSVPIHHKKG